MFKVDEPNQLSDCDGEHGILAILVVISNWDNEIIAQ